MNLNRAAADRLVDYTAAYLQQGRPRQMDEQLLSTCLRLLLKWRSQTLSDRLVALHGRRVLQGPFAGMDYTSQASEGGLAPRLLGTYEAELHPALAAVTARGLQLIYDVGCAEGYYAVGLARAVPGARVRAYDIDARARAQCADLARRNGVADRVEVGERWSAEAMGEVRRGTLVFMDVEGAELDLLSDAVAARLGQADLIVETHPALARGVVEILASRFAPTHDVQIIHECLKLAPEGAFGGRLLSLDAFAATWEWRGTPTPWLVMRPRRAG